jgi:hypothetical protein
VVEQMLNVKRQERKFFRLREKENIITPKTGSHFVQKEVSLFGVLVLYPYQFNKSKFPCNFTCVEFKTSSTTLNSEKCEKQLQRTRIPYFEVFAHQFSYLVSLFSRKINVSDILQIVLAKVNETKSQNQKLNSIIITILP